MSAWHTHGAIDASDSLSWPALLLLLKNIHNKGHEHQSTKIPLPLNRLSSGHTPVEILCQVGERTSSICLPSGDGVPSLATRLGAHMRLFGGFAPLCHRLGLYTGIYCLVVKSKRLNMSARIFFFIFKIQSTNYQGQAISTLR